MSLVGIRNIPSGIAADFLKSQTAKPAGYSPSNELWIKLLQAQGINTTAIAPLLADCGGFIVDAPTYQRLVKEGKVTFQRLLEEILAGKLKLGYANPYTSSTSLNLLYSIFHQAAGRNQPLTVDRVRSPQVSSVFDTFQQQVVVTGVTSQDLRDAFLQDSSQLQVLASGCRGYTQLQKTPGYEQIGFVPYGIPHNSPLVGFEWNTTAQREALAKFAEFATSAPMQALTSKLPPDLLPKIDFIPTPSGEVLQAAQSLWKQRKDIGKTVYMELVVDTSGSMEQDNRLKAVQEALRLASSQINRGNQVGLITFSDRPTRLMNLAPFNELEQKRLFTAIDRLQPDGQTALYDGLVVGLADLMAKQKSDRNGRFYLMLLTDGERTNGLTFDQIKDLVRYSGVKVYPIAYGGVDKAELQAIAKIREGSVYSGNPETVQTLLKDLFQTSL
jgi:Ca-activated chloride channel homolog